MDNKNSCCFTGHRLIPPELVGNIIRTLDLEIRWLFSHGVDTFYTGGALGFDLLAARSVISARNEGLPIKLIIAVPCPDQDRGYPRWDRSEYRLQLAQADQVIRVSEFYFKGCMLVRDRYMVDRSAYCVCWLTEKSGGTAYTVSYAKKRGCQVINLADLPPDDDDLGRDFEGKSEQINLEQVE